MSETVPFTYAFGSGSHVGKVRKANEDFLGDSKSEFGHIFVLCDGMGGHVGGQVASRLAVKAVIEYFDQWDGFRPKKMLLDALHYANNAIALRVHEEPELEGMGTTCVILLICNDRNAYLAHVGDSRAYMMTEDGFARITRDHSFVQRLVDAGQITEEEAETHARRNQLSQALGPSGDALKPEIRNSPIGMKQGDQFLLCSDGLTGYASEAILAEELRRNPITTDDSEEAAQMLNEKVSDLIELANDGGGKDNITVILVQCLSSGFKHTQISPNGEGNFYKNVMPASDLSTQSDKSGEAERSQKTFGQEEDSDSDDEPSNPEPEKPEQANIPPETDTEPESVVEDEPPEEFSGFFKQNRTLIFIILILVIVFLAIANYAFGASGEAANKGVGSRGNTHHLNGTL